MPAYTRPLRLLLVPLLLFSLLVLPSSPPATATSSGDLRIEVITAYNFVVDSNVETPATYAPRSATLGAKVCNDGSNELTDVHTYIGNYISGGGSTPGIYPARTVNESNYSGTFALTHEGGSLGTADAARYLPSLAAGECVTQYWLVSYPRLDSLNRTVTLTVRLNLDRVRRIW